MKKIEAIFMAAVLAVSCAACTTEQGDAGIRPRKVADQRLATYTPIRRLTYRDACRTEGPLTLCVDRVFLSDDTALVEARIKNSSSQPYILENMEKAAVLLANNAHLPLVWNKGETTEFQGLEERAVHFRMEGHFDGEPAIFMVNKIRRISQRQADRGISIAVKLGG